MRPKISTGFRWAFVYCVSTIFVASQSAAQGDPIFREHPKGALVASPLGATGELYREIEDPQTGDRWLLFRDLSHPGGPGHMVLATKGETAAEGYRGSGVYGTQLPGPDSTLPVIHAGDQLIVERETKILQERLEAVALGTAAKGKSFDVRLKIGGRIFRAVAIGPGQAAFAAEHGTER